MTGSPRDLCASLPYGRARSAPRLLRHALVSVTLAAEHLWLEGR